MAEAVTEVVMPLGSETHLQVTSSAHSFVARVPAANTVSIGENVSLVFEMGSAHFFDSSTEEAIA